MFDLGRELKRWFKPQPVFTPPRDGLTGGDAALLELLDLDMLKAEAKAADVAAGRVGAKDRATRHLQQAKVWRELARRSGDAASLRKAASAAEMAAAGFKRGNRLKAWALARTEQGRCAALGADLFGDEGLNAAARIAFSEAEATADKTAAPMALLSHARIEAFSAIAGADADRAFTAIAEYERFLPVAGAHRISRAVRLESLKLRADLGEVLAAAGERFSDERLVERAIATLSVLAAGLDQSYEPLSWARVQTLRGRALVLLGELTGEIGQVIEGVSQLNEVLETLSRDHSPLDWATTQLELASALGALGEAAHGDALDRCVSAYDRALLVLRKIPDVKIRAVAAANRALAIAHRAEVSEDLLALDEAEANFRIELAQADPRRDPVWWAICQTALARIYEVRMTRGGTDPVAKGRALFALNEALEVFSEHGLRELSDAAVCAMERLQVVRRPVGRSN